LIVCLRFMWAPTMLLASRGLERGGSLKSTAGAQHVE